MNPEEQDITIDYFLTPKELENLQLAVLNQEKRVVFQIPSKETMLSVSPLMERFFNVYARMGASSIDDVAANYASLKKNFNSGSFQQAIKEVNDHLFVSYEPDIKLAVVRKPAYLGTIAGIIMKKALNRKGWQVRETPEHDKYGPRYILYPRGTEFRTEENGNNENIESKIGSSMDNPYCDLSIRKFYRGNAGTESK